MKRFRDFLNVIDKVIQPILIPVNPIHGSHAKPVKDESQEPRLIPDNPVQGSHAGKDMDEATKVGDFMYHNHNPHISKDVIGVHNVLNTPEKEYKKALPEHESFKSYTLGSHQINGHLLSKAKGHASYYDHKPEDDQYETETKSAFHEKIAHLDKGFKRKYADLKHDITVFHGTNFDPDKLASQHPQRLIKSAPYMSTSIKPDIAHAFAKEQGSESTRHMLRIHLKKHNPETGKPDKGVYLGGDHEYDRIKSEYPDEHEMLMPRNTVLHIHHEPHELSDGTKIWDAHVAHPKGDRRQLELPFPKTRKKTNAKIS